MADQDVFMILGVHGILGSSFFSKICDMAPDYMIYAFDHSRVDISNPDHVRPIVKYIRPTVIINCAAVSDPEICEDAKAGALMVNARGAEVVAACASDVGAKLVHMSSCHVYDGRRMLAYNERTMPNPVNSYGKSKWDGEIAVRKICPKALIIRPGWLFHYDGENMLVDWISRAERGLKVHVRDDCYGSPTYVPDLVDATLDLVGLGASGVFNVANSEAATMQSFAMSALDLCGLKPNVHVVAGSLVGWFKSAMPKSTILSTKKYSAACGKPVRTWNDALKQCLFVMKRYKP
jgi:dTDP-4-dehydrorhamnose reductase